MGDLSTNPADENGQGALYDIAALRAARKRAVRPASRHQAGASPELLEALKEQIARGEYRPDPEEIARKLTENGF